MLSAKATQTKAFKPIGAGASSSVRVAFSPINRRSNVLVRAEVETKTEAPSTSTVDGAAQTEKYGLEVGLFKVLTQKPADGAPSKTDQAKQLLTQYGSAYLITSISFAIVSFSLCYVAVDAGVNMSQLLSSIGLQVTDTNETVGTFAIAYAAHKALSPVRFPPTVALTPVVAKYLGQKKE